MEKLLRLVFTSVAVILLCQESCCDDMECKFSHYESSEIVQQAKDKLAPLMGLTFQSQDVEGADRYTYKIGICKQPDPIMTEAAVTQYKYVNSVLDPKFTRKVGSLKDVHIMSGSDWVYLEYKGGEKYQSHCSQQEKRSILVITCDPDIDTEDAKMVFVHEDTQKDEDCFYLFEMKHKAVCPTSSGSSGLSVGGILVIVFVTVAGVYLFVGFLYSRFVLGNKGLDQIPNYEFWQDFGNLTADGCDFVCRSGGRGRHAELSGIGDEQIDSDTTRDESLLPM